MIRNPLDVLRCAADRARVHWIESSKRRKTIARRRRALADRVMPLIRDSGTWLSGTARMASWVLSATAPGRPRIAALGLLMILLASGALLTSKAYSNLSIWVGLCLVASCLLTYRTECWLHRAREGAVWVVSGRWILFGFAGASASFLEMGDRDLATSIAVVWTTALLLPLALTGLAALWRISPIAKLVPAMFRDERALLVGVCTLASWKETQDTSGLLSPVFVWGLWVWCLLYRRTVCDWAHPAWTRSLPHLGWLAPIALQIAGFTSNELPKYLLGVFVASSLVGGFGYWSLMRVQRLVPPLDSIEVLPDSIQGHESTYRDVHGLAERLTRSISRSEAGVFGLTGVRGAGKSALARKILYDLRHHYFTLEISSPTRHDGGLSFFVSVCQAVARRVQDDLQPAVDRPQGARMHWLQLGILAAAAACLIWVMAKLQDDTPPAPPTRQDAELFLSAFSMSRNELLPMILDVGTASSIQDWDAAITRRLNHEVGRVLAKVDARSSDDQAELRFALLPHFYSVRPSSRLSWIEKRFAALFNESALDSEREFYVLSPWIRVEALGSGASYWDAIQRVTSELRDNERHMGGALLQLLNDNDDEWSLSNRTGSDRRVSLELNEEAERARSAIQQLVGGGASSAAPNAGPLRSTVGLRLLHETTEAVLQLSPMRQAAKETAEALVEVAKLFARKIQSTKPQVVQTLRANLAKAVSSAVNEQRAAHPDGLGLHEVALADFQDAVQEASKTQDFAHNALAREFLLSLMQEEKRLLVLGEARTGIPQAGFVLTLAELRELNQQLGNYLNALPQAHFGPAAAPPQLFGVKLPNPWPTFDAAGAFWFLTTLFVLIALLDLGLRKGARLCHAVVNPRARPLYEQASAFLQLVAFSSTTESGSGLGVQGLSVSSRRSLAERALTLPGLTARYRAFIEQICQYYNGKAIIVIDELDKMHELAETRALLAEIKGGLFVRGSYYLISISEDAASSFRRRLSSGRDIFESTFDDVARVPTMGVSAALTMLEARLSRASHAASRRVPWEIARIGVLMAGGVPREILRNYRLLAYSQSRSVLEASRVLLERELGEWSEHLTESQLSANDVVRLHQMSRLLHEDLAVLNLSTMQVILAKCMEILDPELARSLAADFESRSPDHALEFRAERLAATGPDIRECLRLQLLVAIAELIQQGAAIEQLEPQLFECHNVLERKPGFAEHLLAEVRTQLRPRSEIQEVAVRVLGTEGTSGNSDARPEITVSATLSG